MSQRSRRATNNKNIRAPITRNRPAKARGIRTKRIEIKPTTRRTNLTSSIRADQKTQITRHPSVNSREKRRGDRQTQGQPIDKVRSSATHGTKAGYYKDPALRPRHLSRKPHISSLDRPLLAGIPIGLDELARIPSDPTNLLEIRARIRKTMRRGDLDHRRMGIEISRRHGHQMIEKVLGTANGHTTTLDQHRTHSNGISDIHKTLQRNELSEKFGYRSIRKIRILSTPKNSTTVNQAKKGANHEHNQQNQ